MDWFKEAKEKVKYEVKNVTPNTEYTWAEDRYHAVNNIVRRVAKASAEKIFQYEGTTYSKDKLGIIVGILSNVNSDVVTTIIPEDRDDFGLEAEEYTSAEQEADDINYCPECGMVLDNEGDCETCGWGE